MTPQNQPNCESSQAVGNVVQETSHQSWFGVGVEEWAGRIEEAFASAKKQALHENEELEKTRVSSSVKSK